MGNRISSLLLVVEITAAIGETEWYKVRAKEPPLKKRADLFLAWGTFLISFPLKAVSFTSCMLSKLSWKWKNEILSCYAK